MRTKLREFRLALSTSIYDIAIIVETWLSDDICPGWLDVDGYDIYRADRSAETSTKKRGGGVLIAVRSSLRSRTVSCFNTNVEQLYIIVQCKIRKYVIGAVYIPPRSDVSIYENHCLSLSEIRSAYPDHHFMIFGDYNLPDATWVNGDYGVSVMCRPGSHATVLSDVVGYLNLFQVNNIPNVHGVFLDLCFCNDSDLVLSRAVDLLFPNDHHHVACSCILRDQFHNNIKYDLTYFDFKNTNMSQLNYYLASFHWNSLLSKVNVDLAVEQFYDILYHGIGLHVPMKRFKSSNFPVWFTRELQNLIIQKKVAHKRFKETGSAADYDIFAAFRASCRVLSATCYSSYLALVENGISFNPRLFWKHLSNMKQSQGYPSTMYYRDRMSHSGAECVNLFADFFGEVYCGDQATIPDYYNDIVECTNLNVNSMSIALSEVYDGIDNLKNTFSFGPDGIPAGVLKACICSVVTPLKLIFNLSLCSGSFPVYWKNSFVTPIHKSGDRSDISNYRGVCIQSAIPKLFDSLVTGFLSWSCNGLIIDEQHGFRPGRSTVTNLLTYQDYLLGAFGNRQCVDSVYTDFSKAFDRVNHTLLLGKLRKMGLSGSALGWIGSFLEGRTQCVRINNYISKEIEALSGVPQGSHCGPLLFLLFVNDIGKFIQNSKFLMFADDLKMFRTVDTLQDCHSLQEDVNGLFRWSTLNGLSLNIKKCVSIGFGRAGRSFIFEYSIDGSRLRQVGEVNDLGVLLDQKLILNKHILSIVQKGYRNLGFITRYCRDFSCSTFKLLYCSIVRSGLEYAAVVWSPHYNVYIEAIEAVQRRFLRTCAFKMAIPPDGYHIDHNNLRGILGISTLETRRLHCDLLLVFKLINGLVDCPYLLDKLTFSVSRRTRGRELFCIPFHTTNYGYHGPISRMMRNFNRFDPRIHGSIDSFKLIVKRL